MKKSIIRVLGITILGLMIICICFVVANHLFKEERYKELQNYTPQQEISEEQMRKTIISLFFKALESDELVTEARPIDAKILLNDPYTLLMNLLIQGPQNDMKEALIPGNTKINKIELNGDTLEIDLTSEFISEFSGNETRKKLMIESIKKTMTQLNEVNGICILIDGNVSFENIE